MTALPNSAAWRRVTWCLAAFIIFGIGVGFVWWPASQRISQLRGHARELYDQANDIEAATRRSAQLHDAQVRVRADLRSLGGIRSSGSVTAALLRLFHDEAKRTGVEILRIEPSSKLERHDDTSFKPQNLIGYDIEIGARGPFRNVIALVADLPRHDVLIDVHDVQLRASGAPRHEPLLDVTLYSSIYRVAPLSGMETQDVRSVR